VESDKICEALMRRRDAISREAAQLIKNIEAERDEAYQKGWDAALRKAISTIDTGVAHV
jgi:cell division septum initiation protein DivIVA